MGRREAIANSVFVCGPALMGLSVVLVVELRRLPGPLAIACGVLLGAGLLLLVVAKSSLFRRGVWISWGPSQMTVLSRRLYKAAYGFVACGALLAALFAL